VNVVAAEVRTPDNVDGAFQALASERLDVGIVLQTSMLLAYNMKRVMSILGVGGLMEAIRA
jgi:hypothetical protein